MAISRGLAVPEILENAPELVTGLEIFLVAFEDLSNDRGESFHGVARIKRRAIREWALTEGVRDQNLEHSLIHHVEALDAFYRDWVVKKSKKGRNTEDVGRGRKERDISAPRKGVRTGRAESR